MSRRKSTSASHVASRFAKACGMPNEGIEPIMEGAVDSLDVNSTGFGNNFAQNGTDLNGKVFSMHIPVLDGLRQAHHGRVLPAEDGPASPNESADDTLFSGLLHSRATHRYTRSA